MARGRRARGSAAGAAAAAATTASARAQRTGARTKRARGGGGGGGGGNGVDGRDVDGEEAQGPDAEARSEEDGRTLADVRPFRVVVLDFHSTLVDNGSSPAWFDRAVAKLAAGNGVSGERERVVKLLDQVWELCRVVDPNSERDIDADKHRDVFFRTLHNGEGLDAALVRALYDTLTEGWTAYEDAVPLVRELKRRGLVVVVLSNVGFDIRPVLSREGLLPHVDHVVLSCDLKLTKPDARVFEHVVRTCNVGAASGITPADCLMVGDNFRDDAAAAAIGIRSLILPRTVGRRHGLGAVLRLVS